MLVAMLLSIRATIGMTVYGFLQLNNRLVQSLEFCPLGGVFGPSAGWKVNLARGPLQVGLHVCSQRVGNLGGEARSTPQEASQARAGSRVAGLDPKF